MSTLVLVLAAGMTVPSIGPEKVSGEIEERLELSGKWEGNVSHHEGISISALLEGGRLVEWEWLGNGPRIAANHQSSVWDEGSGRFRLNLDGERYIGIYKWSSDGVMLCFRLAERGRPTSFRAGNGQHRLILRRVPSGK
jgi:hypothetical protein